MNEPPVHDIRDVIVVPCLIFLALCSLLVVGFIAFGKANEAAPYDPDNEPTYNLPTSSDYSPINEP